MSNCLVGTEALFTLISFTLLTVIFEFVRKLQHMFLEAFFPSVTTDHLKKKILFTSGLHCVLVSY